MIYHQSHQPHQPKFILGTFKVNYAVYFFVPLLILTPCYTYYMAVTKKQEPPYPHATITNTACHYPQAIVFRFAMLLATSFLTIIYFAVFRWIAYLKKKTNYPYDTYAWIQYLAQFSIFGYMAAIGTIDAAGYPNIHSIGAVFFFIVLYILAVVITILMRDIRQWDASSISRGSIVVKQLLVGYLTLIAVYCLYGLATESMLMDDDKFVVIIEWNLVFAGLVWVYSFHRDWKNTYFVLDAK